MEKLSALVAKSRERLLSVAFPDAEQSAQWLVAELTGFGRYDYILYPDKLIDEKVVSLVQSALEKLIEGVPLEYITGRVFFDGLELEVAREVLIPRPETEEMTALLSSFWGESLKKEGFSLLDLGTGSGCLAISFAKRFPLCKICASDVSEQALALAKKNAQKANVSIEFKLGDWAAPWQGRVFDRIVSNPPYIGEFEKNLVSSSALNYEPHLALFAEQDGLSVYKKFSEDLLSLTRPGSVVALEMGFSQAESIFEIFNRSGWTKAQTFKDLNGHNRFFLIERE